MGAILIVNTGHVSPFPPRQQSGGPGAILVRAVWERWPEGPSYLTVKLNCLAGLCVLVPATSPSSREHFPAHVPGQTPGKGRIWMCGVLRLY